MNLRKFFIRFSLIFLWLLLIFGILYLPHWQVLPFQEKSLNVFAWGSSLDGDVLAAFEKETGIKVNLTNYSSNEELLIKMRATQGNDYDLIMPSDYAVDLLIKEELIKPIDRSQLKFWHDLNPVLLAHPFDPENRFSIPFQFEVYGLGVNRNFFKDRPFLPSWRSIYDPTVVDYKIAVNNDPVESILFASSYLYGKTDSITEKEFDGIRDLLVQQREWVEAYSNLRADYFIATDNCPIVLSISSLVKRARALFPYIDFVIPEEGTFVTIENLCMSRATTKEKYIYQLLNYIYTKESYIKHYESFWLFPPLLSPIDELDLEDFQLRLLRISREEFEKFHFFKKTLPQQKILDLWVDVKSF